MANGRDYGSFDYGLGVYGTALVIDATCTIAASSDAAAVPTRTTDATLTVI